MGNGIEWKQNCFFLLYLLVLLIHIFWSFFFRKTDQKLALPCHSFKHFVLSSNQEIGFFYSDSEDFLRGLI